MTLTYSDKVLVLGGSGMLGATLIPVLKAKGRVVESMGRRNSKNYNADMAKTEEAFKLLDSVHPSIIVNLIGLTNVESCEAHPNEAYRGNVRTVENITAWIKQGNKSCHLIHLSTDQVYDGEALHDEDSVTLTNYYAFSKYAGELAAVGVASTILRTNFFGRSLCPDRVSLTDWLFHALLKRESIQVFDDVLFNPLSMIMLSEMIDAVIQKKPLGVFNLGAHGGISKADLAFAFAEELKLSTRSMFRSSIKQAAFLKTYRPKDMRMDCSKFEQAMGIDLPLLNDEIKRVAKEYV